MARPYRIITALRERISLRVQLAAIAGLLCLVLVMVSAAVTANAARSQGREAAQERLSAVASELADQLDYRMFERYREVRNIAALPPLKQMWTSEPDAVRAVLEQMQQTYPDYSWIGYASLDGTVVAATNGHLEGVSVAERPWFIDGSTGPTVKDVHDAKLLSELLGASADGQPFRFVDVAVPVRDESGQIVGVLGAHLSWSFSQATMRSLLMHIPEERMLDVWIVDSAGEALTGSRFGSVPFDAEGLARLRSGEALYDAEQGVFITAAVTTGYLEYPGLGWIAVAAQPESTAMANSQELTSQILQAGSMIALAGALVVALLSGTMLGSLSKLSAEVDQIGRSADARISRVGGSLELVHLSTSIRALMRRLGVAEQEGEVARRAAADATTRMEEKTRRLGEDLSEMRRLADTDALTGLLNRRAFNVFAEDAYQHFRRYKRGVAVLMIDIDYFKRINDTWGHAAGDEVIKAVGAQVGAAIRTTDKLARFGGEEFVVMLREVDPPTAWSLAERMRRQIADTPVDYRGSPVHVTVSIGVAIVSMSDRDTGDAVERADRALYGAKAMGRNRVVAEWNNTDASNAA
ncbi:sensor domain-containing diguanylate cyclase [Devosia sp. RR2S18]|uniref:sensor domain-containing diguanylate cyclase n=1 Tax=Devosia rhizosphaerae TaxID=3049774 RepID=UPI00254215DB|nr:sensor domain-containing diguanylate cyclase [Devosia sp. RR2S18]WIJ26316.1 sensor domain-containing diguanylate cyclase [Devosia sp. RR2S18]